MLNLFRCLLSYPVVAMLSVQADLFQCLLPPPLIASLLFPQAHLKMRICGFPQRDPRLFVIFPLRAPTRLMLIVVASSRSNAERDDAFLKSKLKKLNLKMTMHLLTNLMTMLLNFTDRQC